MQYISPNIEIPNSPDAAKSEAGGKKLATPLTASTVLTQSSQKLVQAALMQDWNNAGMDSVRIRNTLVDFSYAMERNPAFETSAARRIVSSLYRHLELPIVQPNIDAAHAYLGGIFLSGTPIFGVVGEGKGRDDAAKQMEAIIAENSKATGWTRSLGIMLKNALKYNKAGIEVDWIARRTYSITTDTEQDFYQGTSTQVYRAGNEIKCLDMYNTAVDPSVPPAEVHTRGDFSIQVERLTLMQLHQLIGDLKVQGGKVFNENDKLWKSATARNWHFIPRIRDYNIESSDTTDWDKFFTTSAPLDRLKSIAPYEVVTYYRRIIPSMYGLGYVTDANSVQIWKFVEVNGIMIYAERRSNAHNYLPTLFCQPIEDSLGAQNKGYGEVLLPFQNISAVFYRARIASLGRALSDRGLYDPSRINSKDINSTIPTAKIPVRPSAYGTNISEAYYPIPYDDRNSQLIHQDLGFVANAASDAAHINKSQRGQFTKGNRTLEEYRDVMDNSDSTQQMCAIFLEAQLFVPLKTIIKTNILQYQSTGEYVDPAEYKKVPIDPAQLRQALTEFKLADGLVSKDRILGIPALLEAFGTLAQLQVSDPTINQKYDLTKMYVSAMNARGARIDLFEREQQAPQPTNQAPAIPGSSGVA